LFCPCPPVLVPQVAQGAAAGTAALLAVCDTAVRELAQDAGSVVVVGPGHLDRIHPDPASGTLAGFGVPLRAGGANPPELPLALTIGAWLLDRLGVPVARRYVEVGPSGRGPQGWSTGSGALLVLGDGSARLTERAPGGLDPLAPAYDDSVVGALVSGDPAVLAALDLTQGQQMMAAGVPAWRAVGEALRGAGRSWTASLLAREAPYGVSYVVARWQ
jgi:hypothetical protein